MDLLDYLRLILSGRTPPAKLLPIVPNQVVVGARSSRELTLVVQRDYANGEQFGPGGLYWRGRKPLESDGMTAVEKMFAQDDRITPSIKAVVDGMLSRDPEWRLERLGVAESEGVPAEDPELRVITRALNDWHTRGRVHSKLRGAKRAEQWGGRSCLRMYVPDPLPGGPELERGAFGDLEYALSNILVMSVDALSGGAVMDEHDRVIGYYYLYSVPDADGKQEQFVELHGRQTISKFRLEGTEPQLVESAPNPLYNAARPSESGFLMFELAREDGSTITKGVRDSQDHLNASQTDLRMNGQLAGFPTWIFSNLEPARDEDIILASGDVSESLGTTNALNKTGIQIGPGIAMELVGLEIRDDADNTTGYATPGAERLEPIDPEKTLREIKHWRANLLGAYDRLWTEQALIEVSGRSRQEARLAWDKRVLGDVPNVVDAVKWLISTAHMFGTWLTGDAPEREFRVIPRVFADVLPASIDVYIALLQGYSQNVVSLTTVLQNTPVDGMDVDEEMNRLATERRDAQQPSIDGNDGPELPPGSILGSEAS